MNVHKGTKYILAIIFLWTLSIHSILPAKPNVVILYTDDLGYNDVSMNGSEHAVTPNIDAIASNGVRFTQHHSSCGQCSPSRAGLLTGRYGRRFNLNNAILSKKNTYLPANYQTFPKILGSDGYNTMHVGKWHLGGIGLPEEFVARAQGEKISDGPLEHGFDSCVVMAESQYLRVKLTNKGGIYNGGTAFLWRNNQRIIPFYGHWTTYKGDVAAAYIRAHKEEAFFLNVWFDVPHTPIESTPEVFMTKAAQLGFNSGKAQQYSAMVMHMDAQVGKIISALSESGILENTIVYFSSDNGATRAQISKNNLPYQGGKHSIWEGGICMPSAIMWKETIPAGVVLTEPSHQVDVLPTICDFLDIALPGASSGFDGISLKNHLLNGIKLPERDIFSTVGNEHVIIRGKWKMHSSQKLYDLETDIDESDNLYGTGLPIESSLQEVLDAYIAAPHPNVIVNPAYKQKDNWKTWMNGAINSMICADTNYLELGTRDSCKTIAIKGCMTKASDRYNVLANVHVEDSCTLNLIWKNIDNPSLKIDIQQSRVLVNILAPGSHAVTVYDIGGRVVYSQKGFGMKEYSVDVSGEQGLYFLKIVSQGINRFERLILF
jgi:arylsulfatase A